MANLKNKFSANEDSANRAANEDSANKAANERFCEAATKESVVSTFKEIGLRSEKRLSYHLLLNRSLKKISASKNFGEKYSSKITHFSPHFSHSKNSLKNIFLYNIDGKLKEQIFSERRFCEQSCERKILRSCNKRISSKYFQRDRTAV